MLNFSSGMLDTLAPDLSQLTSVTLKDMGDYDSQSCHWISNYLLNTTFREKYPGHFHQIGMSYMRRAEASFREYESARKSLMSYTSGKKENISTYFMAVYHFEQMVSQSYQAYMLMRHFIADSNGAKVASFYKENDGSEVDRLNKIYNHIKHCDGRVTKNEFPKNYSIPVWLTNTGISCPVAELQYNEIIEMLEDIANGANRFVDPKAFLSEPPGYMSETSRDST